MAVTFGIMCTSNTTRALSLSARGTQSYRSLTKPLLSRNRYVPDSHVWGHEIVENSGADRSQNTRVSFSTKRPAILVVCVTHELLKDFGSESLLCGRSEKRHLARIREVLA